MKKSKTFATKETILNSLRMAVRAMFVLFFVAIVIYAILGITFLKYERQEATTTFQTFESNWVYISSDLCKEMISIPARLDVPRGETVRIANVLPVVEDDNMYIIFKGVKQDISVYVGGNFRASFDTDDTRLFGRYSPDVYMMVKISKEDSGKSIVAEYRADNAYSGRIENIYYANSPGFTSFLFQKQGASLIIGIILLIISSVSLIFGIFISVIYKKLVNLTSISATVCCFSICIISNSDIRQFFARNLSAISDISYMIIPLIIVALASYINGQMKHRYDLVYITIGALALGCGLVTFILHFMKIVDMMDSHFAIEIVIALLFAAMLITMLIDIIRGFIREYLLTAIALIIVGFCVCLQTSSYMYRGNPYYLSMAGLELFILLVMSFGDTVSTVYATYNERNLAKYENEAKSQFLANMSHEIRTPINAILGLNTMILRKSKNPEILEYAADIQNSGKNLLALINDILDFSKIESGKMELINVEFDFMHIINDIFNMIQTGAQMKGLELEFQIDQTIPRKLFADDVRIEQILINLLTNAVKYTSEGRITLIIKRTDNSEQALNKEVPHNNADKSISKEASYCNSDCAKGDRVSLYFAVKDTGIGIKEENISLLTEPFVRLDEIENRNIEGSGLGINIVVNLLKLMNSKLEIESSYMEGSTFSFELLLPVVDGQPLGDVNELIGINMASGEKYIPKFISDSVRILVVDDNSMNRIVFRKLLSDMHFQIDEAESGMQCLSMITEEKYDIIFMDHMMPKMDGIETFRYMKEMGDYVNADTPVVILTANAINGSREKYLLEGFDEYLAKPIDIEKLEGVIDRFIPESKKEYNFDKPKQKVAEAADIENNMDRGDYYGENTRTQEDISSLPKMDGINWKIALSNLASKELILQMIDLFSKEAEGELNSLKLLYDNLLEGRAQFDEFRVQAHSMKSNLSTLGCIHVAALAKYLEYAARDKDIATITALFPTFEREWIKLREDMDCNFK